jgi:hypothetical protein
MQEDLYPNPSREQIDSFEDDLPRTNYGEYD